MTVRRNQGTGMFVSDVVGGSYATREDALAAEGSGGHTTANTGLDSSEFFLGQGGLEGGAAPAAAPTVTREQWDRANRRTQPTTLIDRSAMRGPSSNPEDAARAFAGGNTGGAAGVGNVSSQRTRDAFQYYRDIRDPGSVADYLSQQGERVGVSRAGDAVNPSSLDIYYSPEAMGRSAVNRVGSNLGTTADGLGGRPTAQSTATVSSRGGSALDGAGAAPGAPTGDREDNPERRTNEAGAQFQDEFSENEAENENAWDKAWTAIDDIEGGDYALSDEARAFQKEGLEQQRDLLERTLGFDPNAYATQFADQTLARSIATARSQPGGAAAQQAGYMAALEGAPAAYAEGARQAAQIENQRLGTAEAAAKAFGDLGTMTRNSDENRAQFESNLSVEIADQVGKLTQGQVSLNQQESQMFAELWTDFAQLQSVYAGMDSDEQIAWWQNEAAKRGQDKQLEAILAGLKADGAVTSKDLIGGLFQLGGGVIGAGGAIAAARAGRK